MKYYKQSAKWNKVPWKVFYLKGFIYEYVLHFVLYDMFVYTLNFQVCLLEASTPSMHSNFGLIYITSKVLQSTIFCYIIQIYKPNKILWLKKFKLNNCYVKHDFVPWSSLNIKLIFSLTFKMKNIFL